jgi:methionyl-tRNA formyltransferase
MKLIFFGTPNFALPTLASLLADPNFQVLGVVTQPDKRRGRGNQLSPSPVKQLALAHQLPCWQPPRLKKCPETLAHLAQSQADAFVVVAYGQLLSPEILAMPRLGCINVHGSLLPAYRGAAPLQWSLYHGETETGITTMLMDEGMDTGAMLLKTVIPLQLLDSLASISDRLAQLGADLLVETLQQLDQGLLTPIPQDSTQASYAPLLQKADFVLDWHRPALALHNQVRGFYPNALATFRGQPIKILATLPLGEAYWPLLGPDFAPLIQDWPSQASLQGRVGEVVAIWKNYGPIIQTGEGLLLLRELQPTGKRPQSGWDFANGQRINLGEQFSVDRPKPGPTSDLEF